MNSELYDMIYKRKSFHFFRNLEEEGISEEELADINEVWESFDALYPEIKTAIRIIPGSDTNCRRGEEYCILFYSEKKDGYLQNIGYLGEQMDLWLVSKNIGTLWFGIGKMEDNPFEGMEFVIMMAIRKVSDRSKYRKEMLKSKRKPAGAIWEGEPIEGVTDVVMYTPSSCNLQPWIVKCSDDVSGEGADRDGGSRRELRVYRYKEPGKRGIIPAGKVSRSNMIDIGIFLCFLDLCLAHQGIGFEREKVYDDGSDEELHLNAVYKL